MNGGRGSARGFSLLEATISVLVVGGLLAAALTTTGGAGLRRRLEADRARAQLLAQDLVAEILMGSYSDPDAGFGSFGLGADEVGDGSRALFDDVDDYNGWEASPPQHKDGTEIAGLDGWTRSVEIAWADPASPMTDAASESGVKRITVRVRRGEAELASVVALRTWAFEQFQP